MALWSCPQMSLRDQAFVLSNESFIGYRLPWGKELALVRWLSPPEGNPQTESQLKPNNCQQSHQVEHKFSVIKKGFGQHMTASLALHQFVFAQYQSWPSPAFSPLHLSLSNTLDILFIFPFYYMSPCLVWIPPKEDLSQRLTHFLRNKYCRQQDSG